MTLRRGFKKEANDYARDLRSEFHLSHHSPLDPWMLAEKLEIPVFLVSQFSDLVPDVVKFLKTTEGRRTLSAVTLFRGLRRTILHNDFHEPKRQAANIAHELAHAILHHPPMPPFDDHGARHYNKELEEEASWLGPALLISDEAAVWIARNGLSIADASNHFAVSEELVRMRLNVCGAYRRVPGPRAA